MKKLIKLAVFFPVLFAFSQFFWKIFPEINLPEHVKSVLYDIAGPVLLMAVIIYFSCIWLWRTSVFNKLFSFFFGINCYIQGTWKGELSYHYEGKKKTKPAYLVIKQEDIFSVTVWLLTDERTSVSKTASIIPYNGIHRLMYEYGVEDSSENKIKNPLHTGFCVLNIFSSGIKRIINGLYYTSRNTTGNMEFTQRNRRTVMNYQLAEDLFGKG